MTATAHIAASVQSTQAEAWSLCTPLFDQLIDTGLTEWSISEVIV